MKPSLPVLLAALAAVSCSLFRVGAPELAEEYDIARMDLSEEDDRPGPVLGEEERQRLTRQRFPGLERLSFVRVLLWPGDRRGPCWSEVAPPRDMKVRATYALPWRWKEIEAGDFRSLRNLGWSGIYRTPSGTGFERRGDFEHLDLTVESEFLCSCMAGQHGEKKSERRPVRMRLRWQGKGHMPEVSGRASRGERTVGLPVSVTSGRLLTYEFRVKEEFPVPQPNACLGTMAFQLLVEPPFL